MLNADELFTKCQAMIKELHPVAVPGFPTGLFVRMMNAQERSDFEAAYLADSGEAGSFRAALIAATVVNEAGELLFANRPLDAIKGLPAAVLEPLIDKAMDLNGLSKRDREELEKK